MLSRIASNHTARQASRTRVDHHRLPLVPHRACRTVQTVLHPGLGVVTTQLLVYVPSSCPSQWLRALPPTVQSRDWLLRAGF
eukprot:SAG11_NODE_10254_length_844_cov_0.617450_1_plen_81_part_10